MAWNLPGKLLRWLLPVIFLFAGSSFAVAAPDSVLHADSSNVQQNAPSQSKQEEYYKDDYWSYNRQRDKNRKEERNVFDRMWDSLINSIWGSFNDSDGKKRGWNFWNILVLLIFIGIIVFAILKMTNTGVSSLFSGKRKKTETTDATLEDVDIHALDYEELIGSALRSKDYRLAVRLWFLRTLKQLSDKEKLTWKLDKTNSDYYYELSGTGLQEEFGQVSFVYDYIWYGEFPVDEKSYREAEEKFKHFTSSISTQ